MYSIGKADGNLKSAFIPKCHVVAKPAENTPNPLETTVEDAIEVGAEEVEPVEELPDHFRVSYNNISYSFWRLTTYNFKQCDSNVGHLSSLFFFIKALPIS